MKFPRPRPTVRMMIGLVAVAAMLLWGWMTYFDPVRLWKLAIRDKYDINRRWAVAYDAVGGKIRGLDPDRAIAEYVALLGDGSQDVSVRSTAAMGLGRFEGRARQAVPALVAVLRDQSPGMRLIAAISIRQILGDSPEDDPIKKEAVAGLIAAMKDPDDRVRRWSSCCLAWIGEGEVAIPTLIECFKEPDPHRDAQDKILDALSRSGPRAIAAVPAVLEVAKADFVVEGGDVDSNKHRNIRLAQIQMANFLLGFGRREEALDILRQLEKDRDSLIREKAEKILGAAPPQPPQAESESKP